MRRPTYVLVDDDVNRVIAWQITMPRMDSPILFVLAGLVLVAFVVSYKKIRESGALLWGDLSRPVARRRSVSNRARKRALFADRLESALRRLAEQEEWHDSRFAELEAEVELESESAFAWFRLRFGQVPARRIVRVPSLTDALRENKSARLVILEGDPGSGKSVALRHLAQNMALQASRFPDERAVLPIYVNLKTFRPPAGRQVSAVDVKQFVLESLKPSESLDVEDFLNAEFESGRQEGLWLFLFDSFDEIPAVLGAVEAEPVIKHYADAIDGFLGISRSRAVIASREFRGPGRLGWPRFQIMPLTRKQRVDLIRRADLDEEVEESLLDEMDTLESSVQQLLDNPLFLSLVCEYVRYERTMPQSVHGLLENYVMSRLTRDEERIGRRFAITVDAIRAFAEEMAFEMLSSPQLGLSVGQDLIADRVAHRLGRPRDEAIRALGALVYSKIVRVSGGDIAEVAFSHRRLHEYFATRVVINDRGRLRPAELLTNGRWRETAVAVLQTQPPEDSAELLAEAERLLRASLDAGDDRAFPGRPWRPGVLHLLDLLANGLKPQLLTGHSIGSLAGEILEKAWRDGDRLDRKWVVELCAAAGTERMIEYLTRAFDTESLWLRDEAYAQLRRVGPGATRLEPQIRQMLVDMSVGGTLRRERKSVRTQLKRLVRPDPLVRVIQLILAAPVVAAIAGALMGAGLAMALEPDFFGLSSGWAVVSLSVTVAVGSVLLRRFALVSDSRAQRYAGRNLARFGLGSGQTAKETASVLSAGVLVVTVMLGVLATLATVDSGEVSPAVALGVAIWLVFWSHMALFVAVRGPWARRYWPLLPMYFFIALGRFLRENVWFVVSLLVAEAVLAASVAVVFDNVSIDNETFGNWFGGLMYGSLVVFVWIIVGQPLRQVWLRRSDQRTIAVLTLLDDDRPAIADVQLVLAGLRTEQGLQILLRRVRENRWHRAPEVGAFLAFLSRCLEKERAEEDTLARYMRQGRMRFGTRAKYKELVEERFTKPWEDDGVAPQEWAKWWNEYRSGDRAAPLRHPSSESLDELGSLLEDVQRATAFHTDTVSNSPERARPWPGPVDHMSRSSSEIAQSGE